ncbi:hypothetical protein AOQ71_20290 [Bradyrhizobium manausense]|uniref:Uncharacterized protein n=1 Tax=Bradyrhizobium manausense TaxID=989370 RepID=A0A0R3DR37_9BRAD|nr:hypothetical protein AOQ71_20290 [Bradyrhizobium manausense]
MMKLVESVAAMTVHLSRRERSNCAAIRVRGSALSGDLHPLTRAFEATSPRWGEVKEHRA